MLSSTGLSLRLTFDFHFFPWYSFDVELISWLYVMFLPIVKPVFDDFWQLPLQKVIEL